VRTARSVERPCCRRAAPALRLRGGA
jgi:hypothetical protein